MGGAEGRKKGWAKKRKYAPHTKNNPYNKKGGLLFTLAFTPHFDYSTVTSRNPIAAAGTSTFFKRCGCMAAGLVRVSDGYLRHRACSSKTLRK